MSIYISSRCDVRYCPVRNKQGAWEAKQSLRGKVADLVQDVLREADWSSPDRLHIVLQLPLAVNALSFQPAAAEHFCCIKIFLS